MTKEKPEDHISTMPIAIHHTNQIPIPRVLELLDPYWEIAQASECKTIMDGLQVLYLSHGGVLAVCINNRNEFKNFHQIIGSIVKAVNTAGLRIVVFSNNNEILESRTFAQFQFVRCYQTPKQVQRVAEILLRECRNLRQEAVDRERRRTRSLTDNVSRTVVFGARSESSEMVSSNQPRQEWAEKVKLAQAVAACVSPSVPTYLFGPELEWRVRGWFSHLDPESRTLSFTTLTDAARNKLESYALPEGALLSSSSRVDGKVCCALEFLRQDGRTFVFHYPKITKVLQRRSRERRCPPADQQMFLRLYPEEQKGSRLLNVFDFGSGGVGALVPVSSPLPGAVKSQIGPLFLYWQGQEIEVPLASIRHITALDSDSENLLVGLEFQKISPKNQSLMEMFVFQLST